MAHLLPAYVAGTLDAADRHRVDAHLTDCPVCWADLAAWQVIQRATRAVYGVDLADDEGVHQLWQRLDATADPGPPLATSLTYPRQVPVTPAPRRFVAAPPVRRPMTHLATAALLLLTLVTSLLTFGGWRPHPEQVFLGAPSVLERPTAAPTPAPEATMEAVFATTLPVDLVPTAGNLDFLLWHVSLAPHSQAPASAQAWTCCPGPQITHVLDGDLTLRVEGPLQVFRRSALSPGAVPVATVAPKTAVVLHPGDTAVFPHEVPATYSNPGSRPVHLIGGGIFTGAVRNGPLGLPLLDHNEAFSVPALPPGPIDATLVRAVLPPGGEVPAPAPSALVLEVGAAGDADVAQRADGALHNIGPRDETIYVLTLTPTDGASSTPPP